MGLAFIILTNATKNLSDARQTFLNDSCRNFCHEKRYSGYINAKHFAIY